MSLCLTAMRLKTGLIFNSCTSQKKITRIVLDQTNGLAAGIFCPLSQFYGHVISYSQNDIYPRRHLPDLPHAPFLAKKTRGLYRDLHIWIVEVRKSKIVFLVFPIFNHSFYSQSFHNQGFFFFFAIKHGIENFSSETFSTATAASMLGILL